MPIAAAIVAYFLSFSIVPAKPTDPTPPIVGFTPFTLVGSFAPTFDLPTPDGGTLRLADQRGKWVVLNFWATWCPPCRAEMPILQALQDGAFPVPETLGPVTVIALNRDETAAQVKAFTAELGLKLPIALDADGKVSNRYSVIQLPVTYFIDPNGVVRYKVIGEITADLLQRTLQKAANES
jgi:peroxiredoxin